MKNVFIILGLLLFLLIIVIVYANFFKGSTKVIIVLDDRTGLLSNQKNILSIHDPNNHNDFRFVQYSEKNEVTFKDVPAGQYIAHATPAIENEQNHVLIDVEKGDEIRITFTFYPGKSWGYNVEGIPVGRINGGAQGTNLTNVNEAQQKVFRDAQNIGDMIRGYYGR